MSKSYFTIFHNYAHSYGTPYHEVFYDYFIENLPKWYDIFDKIYIVDSFWNFTEEDKYRAWKIKPETIFIKSDISGHMHQQFEKYFPQEDMVMYMDNDCFVYDREGIKCWFKNLGDYDFTAPVAKTSLRLREILWKKCPKLQEKGISTFWGNHFLIRKRFFEKAGKIDWNEYDPFPEGTYLPELDYTTKKGDYGEPACRFYWNIFLGNNWVDMPIVSNQGFHHLHSMSMAYLLIDCKNCL